MGLKDSLKGIFSEEEYDDEEYEYEYDEVDDEVEEMLGAKKAAGTVATDTTLMLIEPRAFAEAQEIAEQVLRNRPVIVSLQRISADQSRRVVDFLSGTAYAIEGNIQKISSNMILCTPSNVEVDGSISEVFQETEEL